MRYDKIMNVTEIYIKVRQKNTHCTHYRYIGMAHEEKNGHHWFMVLFMR